MELLGLKPRVAWWKAQTNPLSYGAPQQIFFVVLNKKMHSAEMK